MTRIWYVPFRVVSEADYQWIYEHLRYEEQEVEEDELTADVYQSI